MMNKQRPILFSSMMVQAILADRKKQTRRVIKNPERLEGLMHQGEEGNWCPYGQVGDLLWVRETWCLSAGKYHYAASVCSPKYDKPDTGWKPSIHMPKVACRIFLKIIGIRVERLQDISDEDAIAEGLEIWNSPVHPGKPEYLDYEEPGNSRESGIGFVTPGASYKSLWESINGAGSYGLNPYVWVIEFERIEKPDVV